MALPIDFYTVISSIKEEKTATFQLRLNAKHAIFEGHFPGKPVTPGVVQLEIIKDLLSETLATKVELKQLTACKYTSILDPETHPEITLTLQHQEVEFGTKITAVIGKEETTFTKVSAIYSPCFLKSDNKA